MRAGALPALCGVVAGLLWPAGARAIPESADVFFRIGQEVSTHHLGLFLYYGPDNLGTASEQVLRIGPDLTLRSRFSQVGFESHPAAGVPVRVPPRGGPTRR